MTVKKKLSSPFAEAIMSGLEEAIRYTRGEDVPGVRVTKYPEQARKAQEPLRA